ncbi:glycosyltransferase family A protein [Brevundimonas sp. 3P9-tot-E]|uniref:glycosyltransferase n=1 Tax=unclassified Brevundimonas TaxID=2622653 RepID=UPI0039A3A6DD
MKIALLDGLPNLMNSAEAEFLARFQIACKNLSNVEARRVVTSDDINEYDPDVVLVLYDFSRKLTKYPTIGMVWNPLSFTEDDPYRILSLKSYDGYLVANKELTNFCNDLQFTRAVRKPVGEFFLPTSYRTDIVAVETVKEPTLCYMGVHWDGGRHAPLFDSLAQRKLITFYGPEDSWERHLADYGGLIPFDGKSVQSTIAKHGVALCLHKREHLRQNTPSMRIFEALSVGALPICDRIDFAIEELSDVALFVDTTKSASKVAKQVEAHMQWIRENRAEAAERARRGKEWFDKNWSLETKIENLILPTLQRVKESMQFDHTPRNYKAANKAAGKDTLCEVIIRTGSRDIESLQRSVDAVIAGDSAECPLGIVIVDYKKRDDIKAFTEDYIAKRLPVKYINSKDNRCRSTALWAGIEATTAPYIAHLDDDDTVFTNHYRVLKQTLQRFPDSPMAFSGGVKIEESEGRYFYAPNFEGPRGETIKETRELCFFDDHDLSRLCHFDNYILSNSWMVRSEAIKAVCEDDPEFEVGEDVYLYLLLAQKGEFKFTNTATAGWHWRSAVADNSMTSVGLHTWARDGRRTIRRLQNLAYYYAPSLESAKLLKARQPTKITIASNHDDPYNEISELGYGIEVDSSYFLEHLRLTNFFSVEKAGAWSKNEIAKVSFKLDEEAIAAGGWLRLEVMTSATADMSRQAKLYVDPEQPVFVPATSWEPRIIHVPLPKKLEEDCTLMVEIDPLHVGSGRPLGVLVKSLEVVREILDKSSARKFAAPTSINEVGAHYYAESQYSHVEIYDRRQGQDRSYCLIQRNGTHYSVEIKLSSIDASEEINSNYIEDEAEPVIRVYFNDHNDDMQCRLKALPPKVVEALKIVITADNAPLLSDVATADRPATATILDVARKTLKPLIATI